MRRKRVSAGAAIREQNERAGKFVIDLVIERLMQQGERWAESMERIAAAQERQAAAVEGLIGRIVKVERDAEKTKRRCTRSKGCILTRNHETHVGRGP